MKNDNKLSSKNYILYTKYNHDYYLKSCILQNYSKCIKVINDNLIKLKNNNNEL